MSLLSERVLVLDKNGILFDVQPVQARRIGPVSTYLSKYMEHAGMFVTNVDEDGWSFYSKKIGSFTGWRLLDALNIKTQYQVDESGEKLVPSFRPAGGSTMMTHRWVPPADMRIIFAVEVKDGGVKETFILWQDRENGRTHRPALPNLYDDASLCLGSSSDSALRGMTDQPFLEVARRAMVEFETGTWNADLISNMPGLAYEMFARNMDGTQRWRECGQWQEACPVVSSGSFNALAEFEHGRHT